MFHAQTRNAVIRKATLGKHKLLGLYMDLRLRVDLDHDDLADLALDGVDGALGLVQEIKLHGSLGSHLLHIGGIGWAMTERQCGIDKAVVVCEVHGRPDVDQLPLPGLDHEAKLALEMTARMFVQFADAKAYKGVHETICLGLNVAAQFLAEAKVRELVVEEMKGAGLVSESLPESQEDRLRESIAVSGMVDGVMVAWQPGDLLSELVPRKVAESMTPKTRKRSAPAVGAPAQA